VGLFCAFIPVPFQMLLAAPSAIIFSANLPVSIALVWITNPITMPPIFFFLIFCRFSVDKQTEWQNNQALS
jgi:uncharacterized protein (DUF2062 family)